MDKNEFNALGQLLYGKSWKKELTRSLGLSEKSRTIDKISLNQRNLSKNIQLSLMILVKSKIQLLTDASRLLEPTLTDDLLQKLSIVYCKGSILLFDENGITEISQKTMQNLTSNNKNDETYICINNIKIDAPKKHEYHNLFQSMIISSIFNDISITSKRAAVAKALLKYFDWTQCQQEEKKLVSLTLIDKDHY